MNLYGPAHVFIRGWVELGVEAYPSWLDLPCSARQCCSHFVDILMTLFPSMALRFGTTFYSPWWEPESKKPSHRGHDLPLRSAPASSSSRSTCSTSQFPPPRLPTNDIQKRGQASLKKYISTQPDGAKLWQEVSGRFGRAEPQRWLGPFAGPARGVERKNGNTLAELA